MKKSHIIISAIGALLIIAGACLVIFWPKSLPFSPVATEEQVEEAAQQLEGETAATSTDEHGKKTADLGKPATDVNDPKMKMIDAVIKASRVDQEFKAMDELLEAQLEQITAAGNMSPEDQEELEHLKKMISSEEMLKSYKEKMAKDFNEDQLKRLEAINENPLIKEMTDARLYNQTADGQKEMMNYWKEFKEDSLSPDRLALLKEYDKASGSTQKTLEMMRSFSQMNTTGNAKDAEKAKKNAAELEKTMRPMIERAQLTQNSKIMANNSDDDIRNRLKLVQDPVYSMEGKVRQDLVLEKVQAVKESTEAREKKRAAEQGEHSEKHDSKAAH